MPGCSPSGATTPRFVLNDPGHAGATILVAGPNFGTGSSREHAVWALVDYGFRAVISPRFGDIFRNNSTRSGLVPAEVSEPTAGRSSTPSHGRCPLEIVVDVERRLVEVPAVGISVPFRLDDDARDRLLAGPRRHRRHLAVRRGDRRLRGSPTGLAAEDHRLSTPLNGSPRRQPTNTSCGPVRGSPRPGERRPRQAAILALARTTRLVAAR